MSGIHMGIASSTESRSEYREIYFPDRDNGKGLRLEKDVVANPGAKVINASNTFPASDPAAYLSWRGSTQSNLYRVRIPD